MQRLVEQLMRFPQDRSGATAIEYGLIAGLISSAVVAGASSTGQTVASMYGAIGSQFAAVVAGLGG